MFAPLRYIAWTRKLYGKVPFDLATSGIPIASWAEIGAREPDLDDVGAYDRLRESIALYNDLPTAAIVPALGTSHAIFLAYAAILSPGDQVLVESPGYEPLTRAAHGLGATVRTFERRVEDDFAIDVERVAACMTPRTRAIVVTNLHNPSGVRASDSTLLELAKVAEARSAYLVVDEVYAPFDDLPEDGIFRHSARKLASNVIAVSSLTKCYGVGMHRIGWVAGPPDVVDDAQTALTATVGHLPLAHAARGVATLSRIGALATRARDLLAGKRAIANAWAASLPSVKWSAPTSGLYGLVTVPGSEDLLPRIESWATEHGVLVAAGTFFGIPNGFRLSWASLPPDRFEEGLARLTALLAPAAATRRPPGPPR